MAGGKQAQPYKKGSVMLTAQELAEVARNSISQYEDKYGSLRPVKDETLLAWASYALPSLEQMISQAFEAYATHPDFLTAEEQEATHLDINSEAVEVLVDGLVARMVSLS
jgi:hypothetical protein